MDTRPNARPNTKMKPNTHNLPHDITRCHGQDCAVRYTCARFVLLNDGDGMTSQIAHGRIENGACLDKIEVRNTMTAGDYL